MLSHQHPSSAPDDLDKTYVSHRDRIGFTSSSQPFNATSVSPRSRIGISLVLESFTLISHWCRSRMIAVSHRVRIRTTPMWHRPPLFITTSQYQTSITSVSHRLDNGSHRPRIGITTVSLPDHIDIAFAPHRYLIGITHLSPRFKTTAVSHRYRNATASVLHRLVSHRYRIGLRSAAHRYHLMVTSITASDHISTPLVSHRYHISTTAVSHRTTSRSHRHHEY